MKITIAPHDINWANQFETIKIEITKLLDGFPIQVEHFGSTAVPGLAAKPVIDILVGIQDLSDFDAIVKLFLKDPSYIYYEVYNKYLPERRLFVKLKAKANLHEFKNVYTEEGEIPHDEINHARYAHIHIWKYGSDDWIRHIAFRDYLKHHDAVRLAYEDLKKALSRKSFKDGLEYNAGKNSFIEEEEKKALDWWYSKKK